MDGNVSILERTGSGSALTRCLSGRLAGFSSAGETDLHGGGGGFFLLISTPAEFKSEH